MPHDLAGQPIQAGDVVWIPAKVLKVHETEEYCNVDLETTEPMYPGDEKRFIVLNAKQVLLQGEPEDVPSPAEVAEVGGS